MIVFKKNGLRVKNPETDIFEDVAGFVAPAGQNGKKGDKGDKGDSPVRGIDYWTEEDVSAIKGYVDDAILGGAW